MTKPKQEPQELIDARNEMLAEQGRVNESPEHTNLVKEMHDRYEKQSEIGRELRKLRKDIASKYIDPSWNYHYRGILIKEVKPAVKNGIKNGLGVKHMCLIRDDDIIKVVKELIQKDLEQTNEKVLVANSEQIQREIDVIQKDKNKLFDKYTILQNKYFEIDTRVNKRDVDKKKEEARKQNRKMIEEKLPEFMDKIQKEVTKCLIVDNLQDKK